MDEQALEALDTFTAAVTGTTADLKASKAVLFPHSSVITATAHTAAAE